jgi:hypothetical protein
MFRLLLEGVTSCPHGAAGYDLCRKRLKGFQYARLYLIPPIELSLADLN